jgi:hypothetical protein
MAIKFYAHFLVEQPQPRGLEEFRGVVELDGQPGRVRATRPNASSREILAVRCRT